MSKVKRILFSVLITSVLLVGCKSNEELLKEGTEEKKVK